MAFDTTQPVNQEQAWIEKYRAALDTNPALSRPNPLRSFAKAIQKAWSAWRAKSLEKSGGRVINKAADPVAPELPGLTSTPTIVGAKRKQIRRETSVQKSGKKRAAKANKAS
ncbi:MAG: hypothetical protein WB729_12895 [Candidatus Sulfotelmatobacter sp.]